jgi:hypothetical protein
VLNAFKLILSCFIINRILTALAKARVGHIKQWTHQTRHSDLLSAFVPEHSSLHNQESKPYQA